MANVNKLRYGRYKILTDLIPNGNIAHDMVVIPQILANSFQYHEKDVQDMTRLEQYFFNDTDIFKREKKSRPDVRNDVSKPICYIACVRKNSYCFGKPFQFISSQAEKQDVIKAFNDALNADNYDSHLTEVTLNSSWSALGYKYVMKPNEDEIEDGMFFKSVTDIDPKQAYCVYANTIDREKVLGVIYYPSREIVGEPPSQTYKDVTIFNVFTKWHTWKFKLDGGIYSPIPFNISIDNVPITLQAYPFDMDINKDLENVEVVARKSMIPLIEYPRNPQRVNDFELAISIINVSNQIISSAADKIQQNVDYVLKLRNIDIGEWDEEGKNPVFDKILRYLEANILPIKSVEGATQQPDASVLDVPLDISQVKDLLTFLKQELYESLFLPTRGSGVGQDTGKAVERRNGFTELEDFAGMIVNSAKMAEREFVKVALNIAKQIPNCPFKDLKPKDIIIKDVRNNIEDLQEATQAFATLINAGVNRTTAYEIAKLVADSIDTAALDEVYAEAQRKKNLEIAKEESKLKTVETYDGNTENDVIETDEESVANKE